MEYKNITINQIIVLSEYFNLSKLYFIFNYIISERHLLYSKSTNIKNVFIIPHMISLKSGLKLSIYVLSKKIYDILDISQIQQQQKSVNEINRIGRSLTNDINIYNKIYKIFTWYIIKYMSNIKIELKIIKKSNNFMILTNKLNIYFNINNDVCEYIVLLICKFINIINKKDHDYMDNLENLMMQCYNFDITFIDSKCKKEILECICREFNVKDNKILYLRMIFIIGYEFDRIINNIEYKTIYKWLVTRKIKNIEEFRQFVEHPLIEMLLFQSNDNKI